MDDKNSEIKNKFLPEPFEFEAPKYAKDVEDTKTEKALKKTDSFLGTHKVTLALSVTLGTIILLSGFYLFWQGKYLFFHVDDSWNTFADRGMLYTLVLPICALIAVLGYMYLIAFVSNRAENYIFSAIEDALEWGWKQLSKRVKSESHESDQGLPKESGNKEYGTPKRVHTLAKCVINLIVNIILIVAAILVFTFLDSSFLPTSVPVIYLIIILLLTIRLIMLTNQLMLCFSNTIGPYNYFLTIVLIALFGLVVFYVGFNHSKKQKDFSLIYMASDLSAPPTDKIQDLNILCPVTTTATTDNTTTTTTDTTASATDATTTTTAPIDMPDDVPVYVILAENKDNYLAAAGMVRQGGRLDLDRDCQIILEKKNQIVLKKTFTEVNVDYIFDYQIEKEVTP